MTIAESIALAVSELPTDKQLEALEIIRVLGQNRSRPLINPEGMAAGAAVDISLEEFQSLRREMWGTSFDAEPPWHQ